MAVRPWLRRFGHAVAYGVGLGLLTLAVLPLVLRYDEAALWAWREVILVAGSLGMTVTGMLAYHLTSSGKKLGRIGAAKRPWRPVERIALLSVAVPPIAGIIASLPFMALVFIGFLIALQFALILLPWSIVTTTVWTAIFVAATHNTQRGGPAPAPAPFWPLLLVFAALLAPATWIVAAQALDDGTRPRDVMTEEIRLDTQRADRWRLTVPAGFVPRTGRRFELARWLGGIGSRPDNALHLLIGADTPPVPLTAQERRNGPLAEERLSRILNMTIGGALRGDPDRRAVEAFTRLEQAACRKTPTANGLVQYEPSGEQRPCMGIGPAAKRFAAGSAPGRYELVITCHYATLSPTAIAAGHAFANRCEIDELDIRGWRVRLRFNERHLATWRQAIRQAIDFLDAHTVESTTGLPGANLGWIRADGR